MKVKTIPVENCFVSQFNPFSKNNFLLVSNINTIIVFSNISLKILKSLNLLFIFGTCYTIVHTTHSLLLNGKHSIVNLSTHRIRELIFKSDRKMIIAVGLQLILSHLGDEFRILNGRSLARNIVHNCVN